MTVRSSAFRQTLFATSVLLLAGAASARAALAAPVFNFTGGNGTIVFGVAPYGPPAAVGPAYIANNFTGRNDILSTPGVGTLGPYQTASPVIANNIFSFGPAALPIAGVQIGGGNVNGAFGAGGIANFGPLIAVGLADSGPGGGSASYGITSEIAKWTNPLAVPIGTSYGMIGAVPLVGNADVLAMRVFITDTAGAFGAGVDLPQLILAISRNGAGNGIGNYNIITVGGTFGLNAGLILDNGNIGAFRAGAVDNQLTTALIPAGDIITVTATLTAYADPANFNTLDISLTPDILNLTGPLAGTSFVGTSAVPEPASIVLGAMGVLCVVGCSARQWRKQAAREKAQAATAP